METLVTTIQNNIETVTGQIVTAAQSAGRDAAGVRLVIVTKAQPAHVVSAVISAGATILGENYPEETVSKMQALANPEGLSWHMIGHLQSRKAILVVNHFHVLQSLDSLHLAEKLERQLAERNKTLPVMLEFNVGGEESKHGWPAWDEKTWDLLIPEVESILSMPHLQLTGVMTMPPLQDQADLSRPHFVRLRKLSEYLGGHFGYQYFRELSMGTSTDFPIAVQEGATLVRVGQAILGSRSPR